MLTQLMQELSKEWELPVSLKQTGENEYTIPLEENLKIKISSPAANTYYFFCELGEVSRGSEETIYTKALLANLFGQGTNDNLLGLNESGTVLTLSRLIEYDIPFKDFKDIVEDFINTIDFWREEVTSNR